MEVDLYDIQVNIVITISQMLNKYLKIFNLELQTIYLSVY